MLMARRVSGAAPRGCRDILLSLAGHQGAPPPAAPRPVPARQTAAGLALGLLCQNEKKRENRRLADARYSALVRLRLPQCKAPLADYGRVRTQDPIWREHGWAAFQAWEKHCRIETGGYVRASSRPARRAASPQPWL